MALTPAEKMRAYRERQKANNQKPVSFLLDVDIADTVTSYAEQHRTTQTDVFNNLLRQVLSSNKLPDNNTVTSYQKEINRLNADILLLHQSKTNLSVKFEELERRNQFLAEQLEISKQVLTRCNTEIIKCQCSTKAGRQCQNSATHETKQGSFYIAVCGQHLCT